jgi:glyoxylase-like metal-dependent hydrolase (beta-lactamase superfamily II)
MKNFWIAKLICILLLFVSFPQFSYSRKISQSVRLSSGAINGVSIERNGKTLVVYGDPKNEIKIADMVLFTDFRRDVIWAGRNLVQKGSLAIVPYDEKSYFTRGDSIWTKFCTTRFHDYYNQTTKIGIIPITVSRFVQGGDTIKWQDLDIKVINTPGYTRGSVSYIADIDRKRYAFVGDLIYGNGNIFDLYSFQDSLLETDSYHGYALRLGELISSLQLIAEQKPDFIIPVRGPVINNPDSSIQILIKRVRALYRNYLSISAYRWYFPEQMNILSNHLLGPSVHVDWMPYSSTIQKNPPSWYNHISNSNLVFAKDSSAFLIDCGEDAYGEIIKLKQSGRLKRLDGIFITHYHDDHVEFINEIDKEFGCPIYVTKQLKDILENPAAYHMPAMTAKPISNLTIMKNGQKMFWKDFTLTFYFFPGQTIYHDAVLFEKNKGENIFFIGDSFTPSGIDDYCLLNRNLLDPGTGYFYCLDILKNLPDNILLANQHVTPPFAFSRQQLDYMTNVLLKRTSILKDLFPWDNLNYGLDEQWVQVYPYGQKANPGQTVNFSVKIFNHSAESKTFIIKLNLPNGFTVEPNIDSLIIRPRAESERKFKVKIPEFASNGVSLITVSIKFDKWDLREWSEGLIEIVKPSS